LDGILGVGVAPRPAASEKSESGIATTKLVFVVVKHTCHAITPTILRISKVPAPMFRPHAGLCPTPGNRAALSDRRKN